MLDGASTILSSPFLTWALHGARTSKATGAISNFNYRLMSRQKATESVAYFVLEHQPEKCNQLPSNGEKLRAWCSW